MEAKEEFVERSFGRVNKNEAELTLQQLEAYLSKIGKRRILEERIDIGIISPYQAQVHYLRQLLRNHPFFAPYKELISINTVDGFQGQERDVILISLVRANDNGDIGFLNDLRRMNVAMTRARMKLIILGDYPSPVLQEAVRVRFLTLLKRERNKHDYLNASFANFMNTGRLSGE